MNLMSNEEKILSILEVLVSEQQKTNQRLDKLDQGQVELTSLVQGIVQHQNEDYALLQDVSNKVDKLANISEIHEQRFQKLRSL